MINNLSTVDPRALYDTMRSEKIIIDAKNHKLHGGDNSDFNKLLNQEVKKKQLKEASEQFESMFINMMFKSMRSNLNKHRILPENPAENIFTDMLYQEYSLQLAKTGDFGLAKQIYDQNSKLVL